MFRFHLTNECNMPWQVVRGALFNLFLYERHVSIQQNTQMSVSFSQIKIKCLFLAEGRLYAQ